MWAIMLKLRMWEQETKKAHPLQESTDFIFVKIKTSLTRKINSLRRLEVQN